MNAQLFSFRDTFRDGYKNLHPGFCVCGVLFVLTSSKPTSEHIKIENRIISEHFRTEGISYLTVAPNQDAVKYNNVPGGVIALDKDIIQFIYNNVPSNKTAHIFDYFTNPT